MGSMAGPLLIAHRGASVEAPENTMAAFERAWELGADGIECDVRLTAEGELVCLHDEDTLRVTGRAESCRELTVAELAALEVRIDGRAGAGRICLLSEVLGSVPERKRVYVEVKDGVEAVEALERELRRGTVGIEQVTVISFRDDVLAAVGRLGLEVATLLLQGWETAEEEQKAVERIDWLWQRCERCGARGMGFEACEEPTAALYAALQERGGESHVWTVDTVELARRYAGMGFRSITTNDPRALAGRV